MLFSVAYIQEKERDMAGNVGNSSAASIPYKMINNKLELPKSNPNPNPKQPLSTILNINKPIKRTMSADMSSLKWVDQHNSCFKKGQSSDHLIALGEDSEEQHCNDDDKRGAFEDIWTSILSKFKNDESGSGSGSGHVLLPPYVHPQMRRTTSSLSEKSLEVCTESLGSETGSNGFSYPGSDPDEEADQPKSVEEEVNFNYECKYEGELVRPNNKCYNLNKASKRVELGPNIRSSFPPPLPSLAHRDGSKLHMRSHRHGGRLVVEAVTVPSQTCFQAHRHAGRLLLTLANDVDDDDEELCDEGINGGMISPSSSSVLVMSKQIELTTPRNNSTWRRNINATVIKPLEDDHDEEKTPLAKPWALSPCSKLTLLQIPVVGPPSTATASALNGYEYYWRRSMTVAVLKPLAGQQNVSVAPQVGKGGSGNMLLLGGNGKLATSVEQQEGVLVVKGARKGVVGTGEKEREKETGYLVPFLRGCKEPRRPLLFLKPCCILTS